MKAFLYILIPVFANTVFGYCIFLFVSFIGADVVMDYNYFAILVCAVLACVVNYRISRREHTVVSVAVANAVLIVFAEIVGFSATDEIEGIVLHAIAAIVFFAPVVHSMMLSRRPIRANTMLIFCEFSIAGTAAFLGIGLGNFDAPLLASVLSVICLVFNLFLLSSLRTEAPVSRKTEVKKQVERGMILTVIITCSVFAAGAVVVFALPAARGALFGMMAAIGRFFVFLGGCITDFFAWLFELLPDPAMPDAEAMPQTGDAAAFTGGEFEELPEMPDAVKIVVIAIIAAVVIAVVVLTVVKSRKKSLRAKTVLDAQEEMERGDGPGRLVIALLHRMIRCLVFYYRLFEKRYTEEGFFVRLSLIAKRKKYDRASSETAVSYLNRLTPILALADAARKSGREHGSFEMTAHYLKGLGESIDRRLYAPDASIIVPVNRDLARHILSAARKMR